MSKRIEVSTTGKCDYCDEPMTQMGAIKGTIKIIRSCDKHLEQARKDIKGDNDEQKDD